RIVWCAEPWRALRAEEPALVSVGRRPGAAWHHVPGWQAECVIGVPHAHEGRSLLMDRDAPSVLCRPSPPKIRTIAGRLARREDFSRQYLAAPQRRDVVLEHRVVVVQERDVRRSYGLARGEPARIVRIECRARRRID